MNSYSTTKRLKHSSNFESGENVQISNVIEFKFEVRHIPTDDQAGPMQQMPYMPHCHIDILYLPCHHCPQTIHVSGHTGVRFYRLVQLLVVSTSPVSYHSS